jgi:hypothetical protein
MVLLQTMRMNRTIRAGFLLLALILPFAGYASALSACGSISAAHHCQEPSSAGHHHSCGDCCGVVAIAAAPSRWQAPRSPASELSDFRSHAEPKLALDRLDRPPRSPA